MSRFKANLIANLAGTGWSALMGLACTPFYIKYMGIEAYGLIGFYILLQTALQVLDLGLSPTMNREMARYSVQPERSAEARDFVHTFGIASWAIGMIIGATIMLASEAIATRWINTAAIPRTEVRVAVMLMGGLVAMQWPLSFYQGGLLGLQRQVLLNAIRMIMLTLSNAGAVLILWLYSPTITAFFSWQLLVLTVQLALIVVFLGRNLPKPSRAARFDPVLVRSIWRFAAGMSGLSISAVILTQLDKVILSKILDLKPFGYYTLAGVVSGGLYVLISPIFNATFPKFSALAAMADEDGIRRLYHQGSQLMAVLVLPVAVTVALFSFDLVFLWTGDVETARHTSPIISTLIMGTALNGLMNLTFALQLAHGWTQIGLRINAFLIVLLVPTTIYLTNRYGAVGGATSWVILNLINMGIGIPLTHRRLLKGEASLWFKRDVSLPFLATILVAGAGKFLVGNPLPPKVAVYTIPAILACAMAASVLVAPQIRTALFGLINQYCAAKE